MTTTTEFLRDVLPATGWHYVLIPKPRRDNPNAIWWFHDPVTDLDDLSLLARHHSKNGVDVYFSLASFQQDRYWDEHKQKTRYRTHENVDQLKAFWLDLDCGPGKDYPSQKAAFTSLFHACQTIGLPRPTWTVSSGNGLHVYWTLPEPIAHSAWKPTAAALETVLQWAGVEPDQSRTKDISSVLRVPGTQNWKDADDPKPVKIIEAASLREPIDFKVFKETLKETLEANGLTAKAVAKLRGRSTASKRSAPEEDGLNSDLSAGVPQKPAFPDCDPEKMANRCQVFQSMRDSKGAFQDEPLWYATLGVLSRETVVNGEAVAKDWSSSFSDFDEDEFSEKFAQAREQFNGPTRCDRFRDISGGLCDGCELKVSSPIQLGADVSQATQDQAGEVIPPMLPGMERDYAYDPSKGGLYRKHDEAEDQLFCSAFPRIAAIYKDQDGEHWARVITRVRPGVDEEADIRISAISAGGVTLQTALGARAGIVTHNPNELTRYMKTWYDTMRNNQSLGALYRQQGWQKDGSFLLGQNRIYRTDDGTVGAELAPLSKALQTAADAHEPRGDLETNVELIDQIYNRPGMEAYQFALLASLGSVLVPLAHEGWVGLPLALWSPKSGGGKTTVCKAGMSFWGNPNANGQMAYSEGATEYALFTMFGERHHIPAMVDETTNWDAKRSSSFLYQAASGLAKMQGAADGGLRDNSTRNWQSIIYTTANRSLISTMVTSLANAGPMIARIFEIRMPPINLDPGDRKLIHRLEKHHGLIGRQFVEYIVKHREKVEDRLTKLIERFQQYESDTDARFWILTAACTVLAGLIAKKLGLVDFDINALERFAKRQLQTLRATVSESEEDVESRFTRMISEMLPQTLITNTDTRPCVINPDFPAPRYKDIIGRYLTDTNTLYITTKAVRRWCSAAGEDYTAFRDAAKTLSAVKSMEKVYRLTTGTKVGSMGSQRCWEIQLPDDSALSEPETINNVKQMDDYR